MNLKLSSKACQKYNLAYDPIWAEEAALPEERIFAMIGDLSIPVSEDLVMLILVENYKFNERNLV